MRGMLWALIQEETTSDLAEAAGDAAEDATRDSRSIFNGIGEFLRNTYDYVVGPNFIGDIIASALVVFLGIVFYRVLTRGVPKVLRWRRKRHEVLDTEAVARIKRQDTAITLTRNALRYVIFAIVVLVLISIFIKNPLPGVAGVLGFGAQSFLRDVIAGFSIVFEGQYSVGDFVEISPPQGVAGIVEELGLRMTKVRALSGEVSYIPNGAIQGVTNYVSGHQRFNVEVQLSDAGAAENVLKSLDEATELYLNPPRLAERNETEDGRVRLRIVAGVLPSMAWLVEEHLVERIKAAAGEDALAAEPLVYKIDQTNLRRVRDLLPEEAERNLPREADKKL
jgi:moderate conductance mechanosensitive channel